MKLQRFAFAAIVTFSLSACDGPQFQDPSSSPSGGSASTAPQGAGPLTELKQTVSAIEKRDPNPATLEQLDGALKEFWRRCEMSAGCRDIDGEYLVRHARQRIGSRAVYAGYWEVWPTLFSKGDAKPLRSIFPQDELQHLLAEGLRRPGTNANKAMHFALANELHEGQSLTYSSTAEVRLLALAWAGGEGNAAHRLALHFEVHGDMRSAYLWALRYKGSGESDYSAWQAKDKRQELASGLSSGERARVEGLADNRSVVTVSAGE